MSKKLDKRLADLEAEAMPVVTVATVIYRGACPDRAKLNLPQSVKTLVTLPANGREPANILAEIERHGYAVRLS